jgi:serine/threonine protein kinase
MDLLIRELATGGELMDFVTSSGRLSEKDARRFFRQIVSGLSHIHDSQVVHRDLKLENILLDKNRNVLISDFGLGRTFDANSTENMMTFCGTPNYAAVELILGNPYNGVKSDIWSLGVILYILVTGQRPFTGPTVGILYKRIKLIEYEKPKYLSPELLELFTKIFVKDPKKRIDMEGIRNHPWVCTEEGPVERYEPRIVGDVDEAVLSKNISSVSGDRNYTVYSFNSFVKYRVTPTAQSSISDFDRKEAIPLARARRKSISICQSQTAAPEEVASPKSQILPFSFSMKGRRKSGAVVEASHSTKSMLRRNSFRESAASTFHKRNQGISESINDSVMLSGSFMKSNSDVKSNGERRTSTDQSVVPALQSNETIESPPITSLQSRRQSIISTGGDDDILEERLVQPRERKMSNISSETSEVPFQTTLNSRRGSMRSNDGSEPFPTSAPRKISMYSQDTNSRRGSLEVSNSPPSTSVMPPPSVMPSLKIDMKAIQENSLYHIIESPKLDHTPRQFPNVNPITIDAVSQNNNLAKPKGRQRSSSELPAREAAMFRRMSMVGPETVTEENGSENSEGVLSFTFEQQELETWHSIHRPPKQIRTMRFPFKKGQFSANLDPATMFQDLHKALLLIKENHIFSVLKFKRVPDYYLFECSYESGDSEKAVKFEAEICKVALLKMNALRIKRIQGDIFDFQKLHKDILDNVNWT